MSEDVKRWKNKIKEVITSKPKEIKFSYNGIVYETIRTFLRGNLIHNIEFPAQIKFRENYTEYVYYYENILHRDIGPAIIRISKSGKVISKIYYTMGDINRYPINNIELPTTIIYRKNGDIKFLEYRRRDLLHRSPINGISKPAVIRYNKLIKDYIKEYWFEGKLHRNPINGISKPAVFWVYPQGISEEYWFNGKRHRFPEDKPVVVHYNGSEITYNEYNGINGPEIKFQRVNIEDNKYNKYIMTEYNK